ncbi:MAG TPA: hypothetical protein VFE23_01525 [Usitatibacter sp.]|jgi:hypothetical protein|nr:hypothetical protein [Usitatibacter sp.]
MRAGGGISRRQRLPSRGSWLLALLAVGAPCHAEPECAETISALRLLVGDPAFPLRWHETTMEDGKPLELSIGERGRSLFLSIVKKDEGMWVEGSGTICANGEGLQVRFAPGAMSIGPSANWLIRWSFSAGADFTLHRLAGGRMTIGTAGWSGQFAAP